MLRSTLLLAVFLVPAAALNPSASALAADDPPVPQAPRVQLVDPDENDIRQEFNGYYVDTAPDYTAESFR